MVSTLLSAWRNARVVSGTVGPAQPTRMLLPLSALSARAFSLVINSELCSLGRKARWPDRHFVCVRLRQVLVTTTPCGGVLEGTLRRYTPQEACDHIQSVNDAMRRIAQARAPPAAPDDVVPTGGLAECKCKCNV